jgi:DNA-binding LytR/AlgR family response regulator
MPGRYTCIIADDNELDRLMATLLVKKYPEIEVSGIYDNALSAIQKAAEIIPDILLLDIDMGKKSGLDIRRSLPDIPVCIFITSHPEYALDGFELNALDFIVKPLKSDRFELAIRRAFNYLKVHEKAFLFEKTIGGDTIFIKDGTENIKIHIHEVLYLEALKDYTRIVLTDTSYTVLSHLGQLLTQQGFTNFIRIHKSYAVAQHRVSKVNAREVYIDDICLPLGRSFKDQIVW